MVSIAPTFQSVSSENLAAHVNLSRYLTSLYPAILSVAVVAVYDIARVFVRVVLHSG